MAVVALGPGGPQEGPRTTVAWKRAWSLVPLAPWLAVLALLLLKPNRTLRTWAVGLGVLAVFLVLNSFPVFGATFQNDANSYVFALTATFLLRHLFQGQPGAAPVQGALGLMGLWILVGVFCGMALDFSRAAVVEAMVAFVVCFGFSAGLVSLLARKRLMAGQAKQV